MRTLQFIAGCHSDVVLDGIDRSYKEVAVDAARRMMEFLSWFDTDLSEHSGASPLPDKLLSLLLIQINLLQRGAPTRASMTAEAYLAEKWGGITNSSDGIGGFKFELDTLEDGIGYDLYRALFIIDPRIKSEVIRKNLLPLSGVILRFVKLLPDDERTPFGEHFLFEHFQNTDDRFKRGKSFSVKLLFNKKHIHIVHEGRCISERDIDSISDIANSRKR